MRYFIILSLIVGLIGCQRMHTETAGGPTAKTNPPYSEKLQRPDPNFPGNAQ